MSGRSGLPSDDGGLSLLIFGALLKDYRYRVIEGRELFYEGRGWTEGVRFHPSPQVPTLLVASADRQL